MVRAVAKGAILFAFGRVPGGPRAYRKLTRQCLGTQATHVDKLKRVWPGYVDVWRHRCGLEMEGLRIWSFEGGWTPYPALASYLLTGNGGVTTNVEAVVQPKYITRAVDGASAWPACGSPTMEARREALVALGRIDSIESLYPRIGAAVLEQVDPERVPLEDGSIDLCHSGGVLEHYRPDRLRSYLYECFRVLRPGGVASHVFDHRDHLHHADRRLPFLNHLAYSPSSYRVLFGHPLGYHNRLLPLEVSEILLEAGFEQIAVRRMILPDRVYVEGDEVLRGHSGIERSRLRAPFQEASDADLRTAAAHYLYRKPRT